MPRDAAALGLLTRLDDLLDVTPAPAESEVNPAFFHACQGGQLRTAQRLLAAAAGADSRRARLRGDATPLEVALNPDIRREQLGMWLREQGANASSSGGE